MKNIKAVISDLDGTLLNKDHRLSEISIKAVKRLVDNGIHFVIATGRHHCDANLIQKAMQVDSYIIAANGATVVNPSGEIIFQAVVDRDIARGVLGIATPDEVYKNIYQGDYWMVERDDKVFEDYYKDDDFKYTLCRFEEQLDKPVNKIFFTSKSHESLLPFEAIIKSKYGEFVDVTFSMPQCLEIMPKGTNKGEALTQTLKLIGVSLDESIAFGDGMNDLEMLSIVGTGYVMDNAHERLINALPDNPRAGLNSEDAVARKLIDIFKLEKERETA